MNYNCLLCKKELQYRITLSWIFSLDPFVERFICDDCHRKFKKIKGPICDGCGKIEENNFCDDCGYWLNNGKTLLANRALYQYRNDAMQDYFKRYKFEGDYYLRNVFKNEFQRFIKRNYSPLQWRYCPIPVDQHTFDNERGFNQVCGLIDGMRYRDYLRFKNKSSRSRIKQSHKNRVERLNTVQPFMLSHPEDVYLKKIVLIDDVYTTGRTLYHAQSLLLNAGALKVTSITLAR